MWIKQSTAVVLSFGPFVDKTDGVTLVSSLASALDHASTGIMLSKNGGALAVRHAAVTATTYDAYGNYRVTLDATDTNTLGALRVQFAAAASCLPVWVDLQVLPANIYDSLVGGSDLLDVSLVQVNGAAQTATLDTIKAETASIQGDTDNIQTRLPAALTGAGNLKADAQVVSDKTGYALAADQAVNVTKIEGVDATDQIRDAILDDATRFHGARIDAAISSRLPTTSYTAPDNADIVAILGYVDTEVAAIKTKTDALPASPAATGDIPSAATIATTVWASGTRTLTSFGTLIADFWANVTRTLTGGDNIVLAKGTGITGLNDLSAAQVNAEADTALADVGLTGTVTGRIDAAMSSRASQTSVDDVPTNGELATALGTADDAVLAAIGGLNNLSQAGVRAAVGLAAANLDTQLDALPTNGELATALAGADDAVLSAIAGLPPAPSAATIATAVRQSVLTEGYAALGDAPTLEEAMTMILQQLSERSISGTVLTIKGLDGSTEVMTFDLDSATTPTSQTRAT